MNCICPARANAYRQQRMYFSQLIFLLTFLLALHGSCVCSPAEIKLVIDLRAELLQR